MAKDKKIGIMNAGPAYLNMPSLFEPSAPILKGGAKGKETYNCELLFDLEDDVQKAAFKEIQKRALEVVQEKFGAEATLDGADGYVHGPGCEPASFKFTKPWKMGDAKAKELEARGKDGSFYKGKVFFRVSSNYKPDIGMVTDEGVSTEVTASDIYAGCLVMSEVNITGIAPMTSNLRDDGTFKDDGYIKIYLNAVVKVGEGKRLSGRSSLATLTSLAGITSQEVVDDDEISL